MIRFEYHNDSFEKNTSENHNLSILIGMDSFIYMITDEQGAVKVLKDYFVNIASGDDKQHAAFINQVLSQDTLIKSSFKEVRVEISDNTFLFVPERLFNPDEVASYLAQAVPLDEETIVSYTKFEDLHSYLVFGFPGYYLNLIRHTHPQAQLVHVAGALQKAYNKYQSFQPETYIGLHFRGNLEFVTVVKNGITQFHHCYQVKESQDALYFLLLAADTMHLSPEDTPVVWSGDLVADSEILKLVKRYFRTVQTIDAGPFQSEDLKENKYLDLIGTIA